MVKARGSRSKTSAILLITATLLTAVVISGCEKGDVYPDRTWAVILEQNFYPPPFTPLDVDYKNTESIVKALKSSGIADEHLLILREGVNRHDMENAFTWLKGKAGNNDTVLFYIFAHGPYLGEDVEFTSWFPRLWEEIGTEQKVLIVDTCFAGLYLRPVMNLESDPGFLIGSSGADELSWCGLKKEGLPVIGSAWLHFFLDAVHNPASDADGDRYISIREAYTSSIKPLQDYMMNTVYAVPEFLEQIHQYNIYPEKMDGYPNPVFYSRGNKNLLLYKIEKNNK